jgi:hypothetical protein
VDDAGHIGFLTHRAEVILSICKHLKWVKAAV